MTGLAIKLALVCIGLGIVAFLAWKIMKAGRDAERAKQLGTTVQSVERARDVENTVRGADDAGIDELRNRWTRK